MADNLIKFKRGSQAAYDALKAADRVDPDTLYFIYDKNAKDFPGFLYLGITPIAGFGDAPGSIPIVEVPDGEPIAEYLNENIDNPTEGDLCVVNGDLYTYNGDEWVNLYEYINSIGGQNVDDIMTALTGGDGNYAPYTGEADAETGEVRSIIGDLIQLYSNVNTIMQEGAPLYWEELE